MVRDRVRCHARAAGSAAGLQRAPRDGFAVGRSARHNVRGRKVAQLPTCRLRTQAIKESIAWTAEARAPACRALTAASCRASAAASGLRRDARRGGG